MAFELKVFKREKLCPIEQNYMIDIFEISYKEKHVAALVHEIRRKVFVVEGRVDPLHEFDEVENDCKHYIAYYKHKAVGTARWRDTLDGIRLERFSVLKEYRNNGIGITLLRRLMTEVLPMRKNIYVHAQTTTVKFFEKAGFRCTGEMFMEANIPHFRMILLNPIQ